MNSMDELRFGMAQIADLLQALGFQTECQLEPDGTAVGAFANGHRRIQFVVGQRLQSVRYTFGASEVDHRSYMEELGVTKQAQLLDYQGTTVESFRRLRRDLEFFGGDFLEGSGEFLQQAAGDL